MITPLTTERYGKPAVFIACSVPLIWLILKIFAVGPLQLGPNPIESIQDTLGIWGLRMLCATLAVTPLSWVAGPLLIRFRRMLGLFAFTYCGLHFLNYLILDQTFDFAAIIEDVIKRPFITIGFLGLLSMAPLAITSTGNWRRKLGRSWNRLHRLVYLTGILASWHFYWQVKKDLTEPLVYCSIIAVLLGMRIARTYRRR
ncbi:MAG: protein-methionine-sulfoxide reductase heme-binding subunit MsrQ [Gammaproteobacteria bacterium]|nr:protein-methionine-sulfoxide reductase heme-binding subunit MsrQ [Gammaproteobacteria bacterium]